MSARETALAEARAIIKRIKHISPAGAQQEARAMVDHLETDERVTVARWVRALADALRASGPVKAAPAKGKR